MKKRYSFMKIITISFQKLYFKYLCGFFNLFEVSAIC